MLTCPSCGFENMKGSQVCARCRARLVWDGPKNRTDFQPPRAATNKSRRQTLFALRAKMQSRANPKGLLDRSPETVVRGAFSPLRGWSLLPFGHKLAAVLSIIPGLGQVSQGRHVQGAAWFFGWLSVFGLMYMLHSNDPRMFVRMAGTLWFVAALVHIFAAVYAAIPDFRQESGEVKSAAFLIAIIGGAIYIVAAYLIQPYLTVIIYENRRIFMR